VREEGAVDELLGVDIGDVGLVAVVPEQDEEDLLVRAMPLQPADEAPEGIVDVLERGPELGALRPVGVRDLVRTEEVRPGELGESPHVEGSQVRVADVVEGLPVEELQSQRAYGAVSAMTFLASTAAPGDRRRRRAVGGRRS
jgi:hypothetical protein